jgi:magnesium transporter
MIAEEVITVDQGGKSFIWVDAENPSALELEGLAEKYMLPFQAVQDCLEPEHLPKFESFGGLNFIILRSFDEKSGDDADSIQELTRKIAIFEQQNLILTVHRSPQKALEEVKSIWKTKARLGETCKGHLVLLDLLASSIKSYLKPINQNRDILEAFETRVFEHDGDTFEDGYFLKRRANTFKRMLHMLIDIQPRLAAAYQDNASAFQDLRETSERLYYEAEEFYDNVTNLVNLHLTISSHRLTEASHKTNEVMRILTVFSVFFMPLNLITGIYGMNFENMPELKWHFGYAMSIGLMLTITSSVAIYFYRKGIFAADPSRQIKS